MDRKKYISGIVLAALALGAFVLMRAPSTSSPASPYGNRDMENIDLANAYEPSQIYVSTLKTALVDGKKVQGTFTVLSQESQDIVGDLQYSIKVSDGNDNRFIESTPVNLPSLAPGATETIDFSQDISALPNGTYKVVVQALHGGGRALGWATNYFTVSGSPKNVILLSDPSLVLAEFNNEKVVADTGPNIDPGAPIGLSAQATNNSATRVVAHPEVRIYPFNAARGVLKTITLDPVVLEAHESKELSLTVPAISTPGVYVTVLSLKGENGVNSNIAEYRTVTRGISADVLSARIATPGLLKGESTYITVEYAGSADAETYFTGSVQVDLQDSVGSLGQVMVGDIHMTDAIGSGMARVVLSRDMVGSPSMRVTIRDQKSHVLSSRTFDAHISLKTLAELRSKTITSQTISWYMKPVWALFATAILLALAGCILLVRRTSRMSFLELANVLHRPLAAVVILSIILANFNVVDAQEFSSAPLADEVVGSDEPDFQNNYFAAFAPTQNGIVVNSARSMASVWGLFPDRQVVSIFVNRPIHDAPVGTYECNAVPLEYRVEFGVCENKLAQAHVIARADKNGGLQTTLDGVNANWKVVYDFMHSSNSCAGALVKTKNICVVAQEKSTTVNITPDAGKYSTTLQVAAKWTSGNRDYFLPVGDTTLPANQRDVTSARNLWVRCSEPPRCGNAKVEAPEQCDDGNPNDNDACTNQCQLTSCGDGIVQNPNGDGDQEQCDDRNQNNNDTCTNQCQLTRCGDGTVQNMNGNGQPEQCDDGNQNNDDSCNNSCQVPMKETDLQILKSAPATVTRGDMITYELAVTNLGTVRAEHIVVRDMIPSGLTYNDAQSEAPCHQVGNTVECPQIDYLSGGQSRTIIIKFDTAQSTCGTVNNIGTVATSTPETNTQNNTDDAQTQVICPVQETDVTITKTATVTLSNDTTSNVNYTLTASNTSTIPAENVVITDTIPQPLIVTSVPSGCTKNGNTLTCTRGTISANGSQEYNISVTAAARSVCGQTIPNTASVATSTQETNPNNNQASAQTNFTCTSLQTDIVVTKYAPPTLNNDSASTFDYRLSAVNATQGVTAENVVITDAIPSVFTINSVPSGCTKNGNMVTCTAGTLTGNALREFVISVTAPARSVCSTRVENTARVTTTTPEINVGNNQTTVFTDFTCTAQETDLEIIKTAPATVKNGEILTYTLAITNHGPARANNIVVRDTIPAGLTYNDAQSETGCHQVGNTVECPQIDYLSAGQSRSIVIRFDTAQSTCGTVNNTGEVATSTSEMSQANNKDTAETMVTCPTQKTELKIEKDGPATFHNDVDGGFAYTIKVTNTTAVPAENVVMSDQIPAPLNLSAPLPSGCNNNGGMVECQLGTLAGNASVTLVIPVTISARANCGGSVTNTARVITSTPETNMNNEDDARTTFTCSQPVPPISCPANGDIRMRVEFFKVANINAGDAIAKVELGIGQTVSPGQQIDLVKNGVTVTDPVVPARRGLNVQRGQNTITFRNHGMASDFITREIMHGRIILEGGRFTAFTNRPNETDPLEEQGNQTFDEDAGDDEVFFQPGAQVIPFYTTVSTGSDNFLLNFEPDPACIVPTDLEIIKTGDATAKVGDTITYKLAVKNISPTRAENIIVRDTIPAGLTYNDAESEVGCHQVGNTVECPQIDYLSSGQSRSILIRFDVAQNTCGTTIQNRATVQTSTQDTNQANNESVFSTTIAACPLPTDIRLEKSAIGTLSNDAVSPFSYTLIVTNVSATAAENVIITDTIPQALTITSVPTGCSANGKTITCLLPTLAANVSHSYLIGVSAPALSLCNNSVTNNAYATTTTPETTTTNNGDDASTSFTCATPTADVAIVKTAAYPTVPYGSTIDYVLTVTNNGPATATNVVVTDTFPSGFKYVAQSGATCNTTNGVMTCTIPSIASQNTVAIQLTLKAPDAPVTQCQNNAVTNTATVTNAVQDPNLANNTSSVQTGLICPPTPSFTITKTDNRTQVQPGEQLTYIVTVTNTSSVQATNVIVRDTLPSFLTYVSSSAGGVNAGQVVTWSGLTFSPLEQKSFTVNATVNASAPNNTVLHNIATVNDTVQAFDDTTVFVPVMTGCIDIIKIAHDEQNQPITPVPTFTFRLAGGQQVTSNASGTAKFTNVATGTQTVTEDLPTGWTQTSVVPANGNVTVASGNQCATVTFTNKRNLSVDVRITKTGLTTVPFGSQITYSIVATNDGPADAQNVVIKDAIPAGMSFVSASGVVCTNTTSEIQCQVGSLLKNQSTPIITVTLTAPAAPTTCTASSVTNTAVVQTTSTDSNTANNTSSAVTQLTCPIATTDLAITKTGPSSVARGSTISYVITATNNGPATATNVVITDNFSPEFTYSTASGATCTTNGTVLTCNLGTMTSGQSTPITVTFNVRTVSGTCSTMTVTNIATIASSTTESNTSNNTSGTVSTQLTCTNTTNDISVYKTDNRTTANVLERLRYSIIITNNNSTAANNLLVTDNVPYGLTILTVSDGGSVNAQQVRWTNISVPANSSRTLYIDTEVRNDVSNGTVVTNTVDVSGKTATDQTTIYRDTYVNPPPPPYYNPPPPYYNPPPPYYPPNPPYYPPNPPPPVIYPQTGDRVAGFYAKNDVSSITPVAPKAAQEDNGYTAVFYATLLAFVAVGSAAATRFISFGL